MIYQIYQIYSALMNDRDLIDASILNQVKLPLQIYSSSQGNILMNSSLKYFSCIHVFFINNPYLTLAPKIV